MACVCYPTGTFGFPGPTAALVRQEADDMLLLAGVRGDAGGQLRNQGASSFALQWKTRGYDNEVSAWL